MAEIAKFAEAIRAMRARYLKGALEKHAPVIYISCRDAKAAALIDALDALVGAPGSALRRHALFRSVDASVALVAAPAAGASAAPPAAKLDDAFAAPAPFRVGDAVLYALRDGSQRPATVVKVHTDDATPYYTVSVDGQERGTERSRLTPAGSGGGQRQRAAEAGSGSSGTAPPPSSSDSSSHVR